MRQILPLPTPLIHIPLAEYWATRAILKYPSLCPDDVRQEAKLSLLKAAQRYRRTRGTFPRYAGIYIRKSLDGYFRDQQWARQSVRLPHDVRRMVNVPAEAWHVHRGFSDVDTGDELRHVFARLSDDERATVALVADGCNYSKAGRLLMISKTAVRKRMRKVIQRMRSQMMPGRAADGHMVKNRSLEDENKESGRFWPDRTGFDPRAILAAVLVLVLMLLSLPARAAVTLSAIAMQSPGFVTLDVRTLSTAEPITGASLRLIPSADVFTLESRDLSSSPFKASYTLPDLPARLTAPMELGGDIANVNAPLSAGSYSLGRYTLAIDPTAIGTYTITLDGDGFYHDAGNDVTPYSGVAAVMITTPEPSLAMVAAAGMLLRPRRR